MREEFAKQEFDEDKLKQDLGLDSLYGEEGFSFVERVGARPTLELNGVYGGFRVKAARRSFEGSPCQNYMPPGGRPGSASGPRRD